MLNKDVIVAMNKAFKILILVLSVIIVVSVLPGCVNREEPLLPSPTPVSPPVSSMPDSIPSELLKVPFTTLVVEDAQMGSQKITVVHHGGDTIINSFKDEPPYWNCLEIKKNGAIITGTMKLNGAVLSAGNFAPGDELELFLEDELTEGDIITVIHTPSESLLLSLKIS